jgi:CBS-domain-containing membrane protein
MTVLSRFFAKMKGGELAPPRQGWREVILSWFGGFLGIGAVALLQEKAGLEQAGMWLVGSFGASAVLVYGATRSPLAQPRNLVLGHVLSALIGVACHKLFPDATWIAAPLAVATAIAIMQLTRSLHPPGGATALIAVIGGPKVTALGFWYALTPVASGVAVLLLVALVVNNLIPSRRYPEYWW